MLRIPSPALPLAGALLLVAACGPAPINPPASPAAHAASGASSAPAAPVAPAPITAGAMPADTQVYAELDGVGALLAGARRAVGDAQLAELRASVVKAMGVDAATGARLLDAIASMHVGGHRNADGMKVAASIVFTDAQPMRDLVASGKLVDHGAAGPYGRRLQTREGSRDALVWFEAPRLLVMGDAPMVDAVTAVVEGRAPGLTDAQRGVTPGERRPALAFVAPSLLDALVQGHVSFAAPLSVAYEVWEGGYRGAFRTALAASGVGAQNLPLAPPRSLALARLLPLETAGYVALSTGIPHGRQGAGLLLAALAGLAGRDADHGVAAVDAVLAPAGVRLADILGALGDEGVVAVVVRPGVVDEKQLEDGYAVALLQDVADAAPVERLLKVARDNLTKKSAKYKVHAEPGGFSANLVGAPIPYLRARLAAGRLLFTAGQRDLVDRTFAAVDKGAGRLADDAAHTRTIAAMPPRSLVRLWFDLGRTLALSGTPAAALPTGPGRPTSALSFTAAPEGDRIRLDLDDVNSLSVFAALGIYGTRRYLANAKAAEAKSTVGAITRAAVAAYEREQLGAGNTVVHSLCQSARPVPSAVPHGVKYQPSAQPGADWNSGDATSGWRCLKFAFSEPHYFRYTYTAGGPYKGPARGGPDPGPNGFEVAAEGDLDGDGVTSLYTRTGRVDPATGTVVISTDMFVDKEGE